MERMAAILSLMLLEPITDRLDFHDSNSSMEESLGLSPKQEVEIEKIYGKYLNEINELLKSDMANDERSRIFDQLTMESKKQAEKLLTVKQLSMLSGNNF